MAFAANAQIGTLNVALSNYMKMFPMPTLVGDTIAPRVDVARQAFQYLVFGREFQRLDRQTLRAPGTVPQNDRMAYGTGLYACQSHALRAAVPYEQEQYTLQLGFSEKAAAVKQLTRKLMIDRENQIAQLVTNTANVTNSITLGGPSMWDSYLTGGVSHPIQTVESQKALIRQAGVEPNTFILSDPIIVALQNHPDILQRFIYTNGRGMVDLDFLSKCFGVNCIRASAVALDNFNVGRYIWGVSAVLCYVEPVTSQSDISALKTFVWTGGPETADGYGVLEFPDPNLDAKADIISVDWYYDIRITAQETLSLFAGCVQQPVVGAIPQPFVG